MLSSKRILIVFLITLFVMSFSNTIFSQEKEELQTEDLLSLDLKDLLNINVTTVSKSEEKQSDAPGILSVVTKDELKRFGGTSLRDILERVPGLIGSTNYMTDRSVISVRGDQIPTTSNHVLFLINGRPIREMLESGILSEIFETFPVNIIEKIEVIKGPGSVLYGTNAFSGVINVITEKAESTGFSINGLLGNKSTVNVFGDLKINSGDLSIVAAGNYTKKPDWQTNYSSSSPMGDIITKNITIPNKGTGVYVGANYKGLSVTGTFNQWESAYIVSDFLWLFDGLGNNKWKKYFGNIGYDTELSDIWSTSLNVSYVQSKFEVSSWPATNRNSNEIVAEWTNFITLSSKSKLVFGGLFNQIEGTEIAGVTVTDAKRSGFGLYTQVDYNFLDNLKAIGGIQLNKIENVDLGFVPRIGIIWSPVQRLNLKALYSQAFRAPSVNEVSIDFPEMQGNSNLKPEKVGTFDVSLGYQGEQTHLAVNYFNSKLTDIIYQDRSGSIPTYANYGDAQTISGVEFEGKYYVNRNLYLTGSTIYQQAKDNHGNKDITPIAKFGAKAGVSYVWDEGITLSLFDVYQGDIESSLMSNGLNPNAGSYNLLYLHSKIDINKLFNMNLNQDIVLLIQVNNLLDKQVWLPNWGLTKGSTIPYIQGRTLYFGLNFSI